MTTTVTITGSGTPIPNADRAGPGVLVSHGETHLQFDAGRGTVMRLDGAGVWPPGLDAVFVTHHHSDHLTGLADVALSRWVMDRTDDCGPLTVVCPAGPAAGFVDRLLDPWDADIAVRREHTGRTTRPDIDLRTFDAPTSPVEVWRADEVRVLATSVRHEPVQPAVGYRIETPDGVVVISGDTRVCDEVAALATGADVLVYEAMRFSEIRRLPPHRQFILDYHADTSLIGAQAAALGVPTVVLTHLIPAPSDAADRQAYVDDLRRGGYEGDIVVADDLDQVTLG